MPWDNNISTSRRRNLLGHIVELRKFAKYKPENSTPDVYAGNMTTAAGDLDSGIMNLSGGPHDGLHRLGKEKML